MAEKYNDLCIDIRKRLMASGDGNPVMTARELVCRASGKTKEQLLEDYNIYATAEIAQKAMEFCKRRENGEPLAYILGQWDFMDMTLFVGPGALIPRDDTEVAAALAIEAAKKAAETTSELKVLDLCAGTGCIGLAVAKNVPEARLVLADVSDEALNICHKNAQSLGLVNRALQLKVDALDDPPSYLGKFDIIVSNPPYIKTADIAALESSVKDFEPSLALDGGADGLDFYRAIIEKWPTALKPGGKLILEMGVGQSDDVLDLLVKNGLGVIGVARDSEGIDRAVLAEIL